MLGFPPRRILVPMDQSEISSLAWLQGKSLAERVRAELQALFVRPEPALKLATHEWRKGGILSKAAETALRVRVGPGGRLKIVDGDPAVEILRRIEAADLVVMGTHGRAGVGRLVLGSVAEAVVRRSPAPVMTLRMGPSPLRSILAPVNFTDYSEAGFDFAVRAASALGARLTALHVEQDFAFGDDPLALLRGMIARLPAASQEACRPRAVLAKGDPVEGILSAARRHDLVILVEHRRHSLSDAVFGTTVERVLRRSPVPVLSVPMPEESVLEAVRLAAGSAHPRG